MPLQITSKQCINETCNQFIQQNDTFCPYCGTPQPVTRAPVATIMLIIIGIVLLSGGAWLIDTRLSAHPASIKTATPAPDTAAPAVLRMPTPDTTASEVTAQMQSATRQAEANATALALQTTAQALDATQIALAGMDQQMERLTQIAALETTAQSIQATQTSQVIMAALETTAQSIQATQTSQAIAEQQATEAAHSAMLTARVPTSTVPPVPRPPTPLPEPVPVRTRDTIAFASERDGNVIGTFIR